jgi:two-component system, chemotaxis family, chemotaxis protein CheY
VPSVLVVDDDADIREFLSAFLSFHGYEVTTAANGAEALRQLRVAKPCVILLDLMMPVMDGVEFRRRQQALQACADIPVLCLSAKYDARETASALGMNACLLKPFEPDAVADAVRKFCQPEE